MTQKDQEFSNLQEPLLAEDVQPVIMDEATRQAAALASKRQVHGAGWAGGISGLLVGGPIGALLFAWGGVHLAKKNAGDPGNFVRKAGDFMARIGDVIKNEWNGDTPTNTDATDVSGGVHSARENAGDTGNFVAKTSDFMAHMGDVVKREWHEAKPTNTDATDQQNNLR